MRSSNPFTFLSFDSFILHPTLQSDLQPSHPQVLDLTSIRSHAWRIQPCSAMDGSNLLTGIDWAVKDVAGRMYYGNQGIGNKVAGGGKVEQGEVGVGEKGETES